MCTEEILLAYPTDELLDAIQTVNLTNSQLEGAARLLAGWVFAQERPRDLAKLSDGLRQTLLEHSLKSGDDDKKERARHAFGGVHAE